MFKTAKAPKFVPSADYTAHQALFIAVKRLCDSLSNEQKAVIFQDEKEAAYFSAAYQQSESVFFKH